MVPKCCLWYVVMVPSADVSVASILLKYLPLDVLKKRSNQSLAFGPKCLMNSVWMSYRPVALPFFSALILASIMVSLKGLINPGPLGYRFRPKRELGSFFGLRPFSSSW